LSFKSVLLQFAVLYAPLLHCPTTQVTPFLWRGPDPHMQDIRGLHDKGIKTILSMRTNGQRKKERLCEELGMHWEWLPTGIFHSPTDDQFDRFRSIVNDPAKRPCYASCEVDMDRTGVYIAAYRLVDQHWTVEQIEEEFRKNHQKRWWPAFRKYKEVVVAYAARRNNANRSSTEEKN
jgi:protein tyrosine phosphatase (PTP) superfamily phosphohydrolase (DUF442 family)